MRHLSGEESGRVPKKKVVHTADSFEIKKSPGRGKGVFAKVRIKKGETIGYYTGDIIRDWHANREPTVPRAI